MKPYRDWVVKKATSGERFDELIPAIAEHVTFAGTMYSIQRNWAPPAGGGPQWANYRLHLALARKITKMATAGRADYIKQCKESEMDPNEDH
jgi:hypothetical protein